MTHDFSNEDIEYMDEEFFSLGSDEKKSDFMDVSSMIEEKEKVESSEPLEYNQHLLLSYLVSEQSLWITCAPIIEEEYFDTQYRPVIRNIKNHVKKYKEMPDMTMIHAETGVLLENPITHKLTDGRRQWVVDSVEEFCRSQAYYAHLLHAAEITQQDKSRETMAFLLKESQRINQISLTTNLGFEVHASAGKVITEAKDDENHTTGISFLDMAMSGGISTPSFNLISAASGDGKSIFMKNMAVYAAERGENVIYYSLELQPSIIMKRFAAIMTETDINLVSANIGSVAAKLKQRRKTDGDIYIVKYPISGTTVADLQAHHLELQMHTGKEFNFLCIDYIDLMTPIEKIDKSNIHLKDKFVSEEANDWAHDSKLVIWSAAQQTKGSQDERVGRQSSVSGGTPKINTCDNLIIGKRNDTDRETHTWWAHIGKNRDGAGTGRQVPLRWDPKTQLMANGSQLMFEESNGDLFGNKLNNTSGGSSTRGKTEHVDIMSRLHGGQS